MTITHSAIPNANLHEPKGASTATVGQIYITDGAGSGAFTDVNNKNLIYITYIIGDISTVGSHWLVCPLAGDITQIDSVIDGAISGADCNLSFEIGGTAVIGGGIVIANAASAAGDVDTATPSAANTLTESQAIEIITNGASTGAVSATITFEIDVS